MPKCLVLFCGNRKGETKGINFYRLTKERYESWMRALGRDPTTGKVAINSNVVCEEHFTNDSFLYINNKKVMQKFSVPTLKLRKYKNFLKWSVDKQNMLGKTESKVSPASISLSISLINTDKPSTSNCTCAPNEDIPENCKMDGCGKTVSIDYLSSLSSGTNKTTALTIGEVPDSSPTILSKKIKLEMDSENLKGNRKKRINSRIFHNNYSLPSRKITKKYLKEVKEEIEILEETLRTSKNCIEKLMEKVDHLKDIVKDLEKEND